MTSARVGLTRHDVMTASEGRRPFAPAGLDRLLPRLAKVSSLPVIPEPQRPDICGHLAPSTVSAWSVIPSRGTRQRWDLGGGAMLTVAKVTQGSAAGYADSLEGKATAPGLGDYYLRNGDVALRSEVVHLLWLGRFEQAHAGARIRHIAGRQTQIWVPKDAQLGQAPSIK